MPRNSASSRIEPGDLVVVAGGRTGRDGIHGATFSSIELSSASESQSGGSVQIGHAIHEKTLTDFVLEASRQKLFSAITDCGAGGLSSAVGEMAATLGAEVKLETVPLKYAGLSATEVWISEAQERMVLAVPPAKWDQLAAVATEIPGEQVRLTQYGYNSGRLSIVGEATDVSQAYEFFERVKKSPLLQDYDWTSGQPQLAGRNKVKFEMEGVRPDAKTSEE
jgi:phosphoribosylformylglycinamidine synthase